MDLSNLRPPAGQVKTQRRIGRGMGSGRGKYSGRGAKGQKSISGYSHMRGFEGGQMPLHRRLPKRGFTNALFKKHFAIVNLATLEQLEGDSFTPESLLKAGVIHKLGDGLKVLANGELTRKIHVEAQCFSAAAEEKINAVGGSVTVLQPKVAAITVKHLAGIEAKKVARAKAAANRPAPAPKAEAKADDAAEGKAKDAKPAKAKGEAKPAEAKSGDPKPKAKDKAPQGDAPAAKKPKKSE